LLRIMAMTSRFSSWRCLRPLVWISFLLVLPLSAKQDADDFSSIASAASAARENGRREEAIRLYQKAVARNGNWTEGWWYLGTLSYDADKFTDAARAFKKVADLSPGLGAAWSFLGLCEFEANNYAAAQSELERGIALGNPDDPDIDRVARFHLALLLIRSQDFLRARQLLVPQFTAPPTPEQVRTALGLLLLRVPLLPQEIEPSRDAILSAAGDLELELIAGKTAESLTALQAFVGQNQEQPVAHEILARCYDALQNFAEAATERATAGRLSRKSPDPANGDAEFTAFFARADSGGAAKSDRGSANGNAVAFRALAGQAADLQRSGNPGAAIPLYQQALELRPEWDEGRWNLAMMYYSTQQFPATIDSLKLWLERNPSSGTAWGVLGLSEFETRDYDNALVHLQRGDSLGLGASAEALRNARYHLAILLNRKSEFVRASRILSSEAGPGVLADEIAFALGMCFLRMPQLPVEVSPAERALVEGTGQVATLLAGNKYDLALPKLRELIREYPKTPFLHYVYGSALSSLSMFDEAAAQFELETQVSPRSELPLVELVALELQRRSPGEALVPAKRAIEIAPASPPAHYVLGRVYLELGQTEPAVRELQQAASLSPNSPEIHFQLARAYTRQNLAEKAAAERVVFQRLNAAAEQARRSTGSQSYGAMQPAAGVSAGDPDSQPSASPPME
jgi:tetratricopeptide (TPR) repeat protein